MKFLKKSLLFGLVCICAAGLMGCAPKENVAKKVLNDAHIVVDTKELATIIEEVETRKEEAEQAAKQEAAEVVKPTEKVENKTDNKVASNKKPSSKPSTSTTNKNTSSKYPYVSAVDVFGVVLNVSTSGNLDITTAGEYVIHYTTTDARGNTMTASAIITVVENPADNEGSEDGENDEKEGYAT